MSTALFLLLATAQAVPTRLEPGKPVERELAGAREHLYRLFLRRGQFLHLIVDQRGIDVVVTLVGPGGAELLEVDSPNGSDGPEPLFFVSTLSGEYRLRVRALEPAAATGRYVARIETLREATARDGARVAADRAFEAAKLLVDRSEPDSLRAAIAAYLEALPYYLAEGNRRREGEALYGIADAYFGLGRSDSALHYFRRSLPARREAGDELGAALALNGIGFIEQSAGQLDSALAHFHESLAIRRRLGSSTAQWAVLNNIALVYEDLAHPDSAIAYARRALALTREEGNRPAQITMLQRLGGVYFGVAQRDSAIALFHQALLISDDLEDRAGAAGLRNWIGYAHYFSRRPDSALPYARRAVELFREVGDRRGEANSLNNLGLLHDYLGHADSAQVLFRAVIAIAGESGDSANQAAALHNIGRAFVESGRADSALPYFHRALELQRALRVRSEEAANLRALAGAYRRRRAFATSAAYSDSSAALHSSISAHAGGEVNQVSFAEGLVSMYAGWAKAWLAREPEVGAVTSALSALAVTEQGRAQALLELLRKTASAAVMGRDLAAEGAGYLRAATRSGASVLSYLVTSDTLIVWYAAPGRAIRVEQHGVTLDSLNSLVRALRGTLARGLALRGVARADGSGSASAASSRALGRLLLPHGLADRPAAPRELIIVPHSVLGLVPFAALPLDERGTLLGTRYAVRYAPSLAVLGEVESRGRLLPESPRNSMLTTALIVGNPVMPVRAPDGTALGLARLAGADAEANWLGARLGRPALSGDAATESAVRQRLALAPLVHFATHGYVYDTDAKARNSFIAFAPDSAHDGLLTVGEVLDDPALTLRAELVVLSACDTGLGDLKEAEGTIGLQRAFLARGARSLLVSLWNVSDAATALLMQRFYTHWLDDSDRPSKAEALRRAQEEVRATPGFEAPRYWAAFQLVGAG